MRLSLILISFTLLLTSCSSIESLVCSSQESDIESIRKNSAALLQVEQVDEVRKTPIEGLFEVRSGTKLYYADAKGDYFVLGASIIDTAAKKNLTNARKEEINRIDWSQLPLDKAIISGDKNAKLKLAIFTDPDCPYCRKLEEELKLLKGVTVYTFLYPLVQLHPNAWAKSEGIWCSEDQHGMLQKVMLERFIPEAASCETPLDAIAALAQKLNINGTPAMIAGDGRMVAGGKAAADIKAWLENR